MEIEVHSLNCEHPFGDGIHVMVPPDGSILLAMLYAIGVAEEVRADARSLKKLVTEGKAATSCKVYEGESPNPNGGTTVHAVVSVLVKQEEPSSFLAVFLMIEDGYEKLGAQVIQLLKTAMREHLLPNFNEHHRN